MAVSDALNLDYVCISIQDVFSAFITYSSCSPAANMVPAAVLLPSGLLITGWAVQKRLFWVVPDVVRDPNCTLGGGAH